MAKNDDNKNWRPPMPDEAWDRWKDLNKRASENIGTFTRDWFEDVRSFAQEFNKEALGIEETYTSVVAWQPVTLARDTRCHHSQKKMKKGTQAYVGISELLPPVFVTAESHRKIVGDDEKEEKKKE